MSYRLADKDETLFKQQSAVWLNKNTGQISKLLKLLRVYVHSLHMCDHTSMSHNKMLVI